MNKFLIAFAIIGGAIISTWVVGRISGVLDNFKVFSTANYPTFRTGQKFFVSNLKKPARFDFICFEHTTPEFGKQIWFYRLVGLSGDVIELKNGVLFVNNENADAFLSLAHNYYVPYNNAYQIQELENNVDELNMQIISDDTVIMYLSDANVKKHKMDVVKITLPKEEKNEAIEAVYEKPWNQDHFGPVVVPTGKYFVLGDNRLNARDSRYIGFIDQKRFRGTALRK